MLNTKEKYVNCSKKQKRYEKSYIHKKPKSDIKSNYSSFLYNYKFNSVDKKFIDDKIDSKYK